MIKLKSLSKAHVFIIVYVVAIVLVPGISVREKTVFAAEILLLPLFILYCWRLCAGKVRLPPKPLLWILLSLMVCFIFGYFRRNVGAEISIYAAELGQDDSFKFSRDIIKLFRWMGIFSTPWIVSQVFRNDDKNENYLQFFIKSVVVIVFISSLLSLAEHFNLIKLSEIYNYERGKTWSDRSYGTFSSPLEAAMVYGLTLVLTFQIIFEDFRENYIFLLVFPSICFALVLTQSATGFLAAIMGIAFLIFSRLPTKARAGVLLLIGLSMAILSLFLPKLWISWKVQNFLSRTLIWKAWLFLIPKHPWFGIAGMGFTNIVIDNSFLFMLVTGGVLLFVAFLSWAARLIKFSDTKIYPLLIVWMLSWLTLDSVGYWGIGRLGWFALGLGLSHSLANLASKPQ